jgi:glutaredoxin 3
MRPVTIYTRDFCGYCSRALRLLEEKGAPINEIEAGGDPELKREMIQRSNGGTTFPQIFIGDEHIGGCDELYDLEAEGRLDALLAA